MKKIIDILPQNLHLLLPADKHDLNVDGVSSDSRKIQKDWLFVAIKGGVVDGFQFISKAIPQGTRLIVCDIDHPYQDAQKKYKDIVFIPVPNPRYVLSLLLAAFYAPLPSICGAVTGTNGKTTVAELTRQLMEMIEVKAASYGTLGIKLTDSIIETQHTTASPEVLYHHLSKVKQKEYEHIIFEASSHGLDQYRLDGISFSVTAFTNLSRDHMDYHPNEEAYFLAKKRLFDDLTEKDGTIIINADDPYGQRIIESAQGKIKEILSVGTSKKATLCIHQIEALPDGQAVTYSYCGKEYNLKTSLLGKFNIYNIFTAALMVSRLINNELETIFDLLPKLVAVEGRMEWVSSYNGGGVYVDYAHTPDALEKALISLRKHTDKRLICIFGCGGDRDKGKRPQMGGIACDNSDHVIITNDNPRTENPEDIHQDIITEFKEDASYQVIPDRREAIAKGIAQLKKGDILLVAGKGHEEGQIIQDIKYPFKDKNVILELV